MTTAPKSAAAIRAEGAAMTYPEVVHITAKFVNEIGGVYEVVAAAIRRDHAHLYDIREGADD